MDIYNTNVLIQNLESLKRPQSFLLDMFYPNVVNFDTKEISIDVDVGKRRVAPFVTPKQRGRLVESRKIQTGVFTPAYIKDKRAIDPERPLQRQAGERIGGGQMSAAEREMAVLNFEQEDQVEMIMRRKEVMAADALIDGKTVVTYLGDDGSISKVVEVDFQRDPALTVDIGGDATKDWLAGSAPTPADDIETYAETVLQKSGAVCRQLIFTPKSWRGFKKDPEIKEAIDFRRGGDSRIDLGLVVETGAVFKGVWGNFELYLYNDWWIDPTDDTEKRILPDGIVLVGSRQMEGVQAQGAIQDPGFAYGALEMAPKSWIEEDPAQRLLMMQSAPLPIPSRVNTLLAATVAN